VETIASSQNPNGSWCDFCINPVGASDQWVTAYVGLKMCGLRDDYEIEGLLHSADQFIRDNWHEGLGYNSLSPPDADSTAHALLFWRALGTGVSQSHLTPLLSFQREDGGFATFRADAIIGPNSGAVAHCEVTATAIQALSLMKTKNMVDQSINRAFLWAVLVSDWETCIESFWWNLNWYGRLEWIKALRVANRNIPSALVPPFYSKQIPITSHLDAAYYLELALVLGRISDARTVAGFFLETQLKSGLWPTVPILRTVHPNCYVPWKDALNQPTHSDNGIYSGAAIAHALSLFLKSGAT
jgi:hypothetical protein